MKKNTPMKAPKKIEASSKLGDAVDAVESDIVSFLTFWQAIKVSTVETRAVD